MNEEEECSVCFDKLEKSHAEPSCGHDNICLNCYKKMVSCPLCRDLWFITVRIKTLTGNLYTLQWGVGEKTEDFVKTLCKLVNPKYTTGQLVYNGRVLSDESTPHSRNIEDNSIIHFIENFRGD
jgi:hypothetical protein